MNTHKLPDKPSELIRLALTDVEKVKQDPRYTLYMGVWHTPDGNKCLVCLAGSVMAKTLEVPDWQTLHRRDFDDDTRRKLAALNEFRGGYIGYGLGLMKITPPDGIPSTIEANYDLPDPERSLDTARRVADILEKAGL